MKRHGNIIQAVHLGRTEYRSCWTVQQRLFELRSAGRIPDTLLLTEHDHVYTIGKTGNENHLLADASELASRGVAVVYSDRGGDITYHGPGQLVGYPILDLMSYYCDLHRYLRDLEEVVIRTLALDGVCARRLAGYTGVWVGKEKICAIGVKSSRWVTMHGFALNVSTDLSFFERIIPCGIFEHGVTSMDVVLGRPVSRDEIASRLVGEFGEVFEAEMITGDLPATADLSELLTQRAAEHS
jgi:lipoyl(octanoyl) transferase